MLASAIFLIGEVQGMRAVVVADAVSYVLATGLLWVAVRGLRTHPRDAEVKQHKGYRVVLADRGNVALAAMNVIATLLVTAPLLAMPILIIDQLHFALWLPALLGALNTVAIAATTFFVARLLGRRPSLTALVVASLMWAAGCLAYAVASLNVLAVALLPFGIVALGLGEAAYAPSADRPHWNWHRLDCRVAIRPYTNSAGGSRLPSPRFWRATAGAGRPTLWVVLGAASIVLALGYAVASVSLFDRFRTA